MKNFKSNNFIPYGKHTVTEDDINLVTSVLKNESLTQGKFVPKFEYSISSKLKSKHAISVNSATSALHLSCLALGVGLGDIVWTSPISFVASANCALYCGGKIDFVDIDPKTGLLDIDCLETKLKIAKQNNSLPKVVIPVHLGGSSCDMEKIYNLSLQYGFSVIEDASHAIGGKYQDEPVGNCKYSSISVFSFHPVKIITTGEGGLITTNHDKLAEKIKRLRSHGIIKDPDQFKNSTNGSWWYEQHYLGFNYRMSDIQAALGLSQLSRLDKIIEERNRQLEFYYDICAELPIKHLLIPSNVISSVHLAIIKLKKISETYYLKVFEGMRSEGIGVQLHYIPIYKQPYFKRFKFDQKSFPGAEEHSKTAISIPLYPGLKKEQQLKVKNILKKFL